jgi:hypothetical protein
LTRIKFFSLGLILVLIISGLVVADPGFAFAKTHRAKVVKAGLSDASFTDTNALTTTEIQNTLASNGSFLRNFRENGRSAAEIIQDAARGHGDASGTMNGIGINHTVSPVVILATLQKEQSLITMRDRNDNSLRAAMGYACPDSGGCNEKYNGFTKQVENGAWQLRYNYERAKGHGFRDYQVGQTVVIDGVKTKITSRFQSSLLRYTPHSCSNFTTYFNKWSKGTTVAAAASTAVDANLAAKCLVGSKSTRRACRIAQSKAAVVGVVTNVASTVSTTLNCSIGSKSVQRACRIQKAKLEAQQK